jgi:hypothetical protein
MDRLKLSADFCGIEQVAKASLRPRESHRGSIGADNEVRADLVGV